VLLRANFVDNLVSQHRSIAIVASWLGVALWQVLKGMYTIVRGYGSQLKLTSVLSPVLPLVSRSKRFAAPGEAARRVPVC
jgi:hypothetical protein